MKSTYLAALAAAVLLAGCASPPTPTPSPTPAPELAPAPAPHSTPVKHPALGTKGMKSLQHELAARGYYHGKIDGVNGARTRNAVARYQQDLGVQPVTGEADEQTWSSLGLSE